MKTTPVSDTMPVQSTENKSRDLKKSIKLFDNKQPFEITSFTSTLNNYTTDTDTAKCGRWILNKQDFEKIIKNAEPIDGTTWDLSFSVLTCTKTVNVVQGGQQFTVEINAASFLSINNGDTTVLLGDYNKSDRKRFIEQPGDK
ncbi:hypothetical protein [Ferruginibacter sp.]